MENDLIQPQSHGDYTPEFTAYALANGRAPWKQREHDAKEFVGRPLHGFILWMREAQREFERVNEGYSLHGTPERLEKMLHDFLAAYAIRQAADAQAAAESKAIFG